MLFSSLLMFSSTVSLYYCSRVSLFTVPSELFRLKDTGAVSHILFSLLRLFSAPKMKTLHFSCITFALDAVLMIK